MSDKQREIVKELAAMTILSGKICPIQEKTLKMYPFILFDGVESAEIDYDFSRPEDTTEGIKHNSYVRFKVKAKGPQVNLKRKYSYLEMSVRDLFWDEVQVQVLLNGEPAFKSGDGHAK